MTSHSALTILVVMTTPCHPPATKMSVATKHYGCRVDAYPFKQLEGARMPMIGVFWVAGGQGIAKAERFADGVERVAGMLDSELTHAAVWESYRSAFDDPSIGAYCEYDHFPRGRVLYSIADARTVVYMDKRLFTRSNMEWVARMFDFDAKSARWARDPHYAPCVPIPHDLQLESCNDVDEIVGGCEHRIGQPDDE